MSLSNLHNVGAVLDGRYLLEEVLGAGGMGVVYRATHLTLDSDVALKVLNAEFSRDEGYRRRFEREARVSSKLKHPNAVQIHDFGISDGLLYIVMEFIEGVGLRRVMEAHKSLVPYHKIHHYASSIASVLVAAHAVPLVHRDLKPENILIAKVKGADERLVVVDFGLAFVVDSGDLGRMTEAGVVVGTPLYVSPEQAEGETVTPAADVYALGCVLYELCMGRPPFVGKSTVQILNSHLFVPPPAMTASASRVGASPAFQALVLSMLEKRPSDRPDAAEVLEALRGMEPRPPSMSEMGLFESDEDDDKTLADEHVELPLMETVMMNDTIFEPALGDQETGSVPHQILTEVGEGKKVAFVDHPISAEAIELFGANRFSCHLHSATAALEPGSYDAIFAPKADATQIATLARSGIPVVVACKRGERRDASTLRAAGAAEVLSLPIKPRQLVYEILQVEKRARRRRESQYS